ncbi:MAG: helix-turn-helix domain-containing protein, partial [Kofleriaceae bacterium]|nr:helix-turn-helix domain-containing protein [Kofleriaceae bacterium]
DAGLQRPDDTVRQPDAHYEVVIASRTGGELVTSCGLPIRTTGLASLEPRASDTVLVAGGGKEPITSAVRDTALLRWLANAATIVRRIGSVCSGAFVLAAAGLLDGKRAATHWSACDQLAKRFPCVEVDRNAIFVVDGNLWTSAGVTTGIDMSLAIVEEDLGRDVTDAIAAQLVLYMRRPGYQSQWSDALVARDGAAALAPAIAWARANLAKADLETVAQKVGLSLRTFHRRCLEQLDTTPAKLIEKLRVERARDLVESGDLPAKTLAAQCGFSSAAQMKRAFERELGFGLRAYRLLHRA